MLSSIPERAAAARLPALRAQALIPQLVRETLGRIPAGQLLRIKNWSTLGIWQVQAQGWSQG